MTITYPKDASLTKETFGVGARVDVDAGKVHEVWMGKEGTRSPIPLSSCEVNE